MGKEQNMNFDLPTFRFVSDMGTGLNGWNNVTLDDLKNHVECLENEYSITEKEMPDVFASVKNVKVFLKAIENDRLSDSDERDRDPQVISYYMENGIVTRLYGPCFYKTDEGQFVLRVGRTLYNASLKEGKIIVGNLRGSVSITRRADAEGNVIKDDKGNAILSVTAKLLDRTVKGDQEMIYIPLILDKEAKVSEALLTLALEEDNICEYMATVPKGGGGKFYDMRMLPVGDYLVTDISDPKTYDYNGKPLKSWNITIKGLGIVSSRTRPLESRLEQSLVLLQKKARNGGVVLRVSKHDVEYTTANGKMHSSFQEFIVHLQNGEILGLPSGKIGNKDVQHQMEVNFVDEMNTKINPVFVQTVEKIGGMIFGSQDTVSLIEPTKSAAPKADEKPDNYDDIPF